MNVKAIAHICLDSRDLKKTIEFYGILGLKPMFKFIDQHGALRGCYLRISDSNFIEIFEKPSVPETAGAIAHFCLEVDGMDAYRRKLMDAGLKVTNKKLASDESYQFWVTDPDGNRIEFHEYTPQSCQKTGKDCIINW